MEENKSISSGTNRPSNLWIGLVLIFAGAVILLNQLDILPFRLNWWALFALFPAFGALTRAVNRYRSTSDVFEMGVMIPALVGLFMLLLVVSLFAGDAIDLNLRTYWPIIIIVLGLGLILGRRRRS
jgi:drug/metabolite transporter (DMT)-like permease